MENLLFIHPSKKVLSKKDNLYTNESLTPSLGLASLAAYCREHNIKSEILDLRLPQYQISDVISYIEKNRPILVGISAFTGEITSAGKIAEIIKKKLPHTFIVVGGPHASAIPAETLEEFEGFDAAVVGEGENAIVEMTKVLKQKNSDDLHKINGVAIRGKSGIELTPPGEPVDVNSLPIPAWDLFELEHYNTILPVSTSRGCPYPCYFCNPNYLGRKVRVKTFDKVVDDIQYCTENYGITRFQFADATLGLLKESAVKMCDELIERGLSEKIKWDCEIRADSINEELLRRMKAAGCECIALGIETGNEQILKEVVKKKETKGQMREAVRLAKKIGLTVRCFFILGHYRETEDTIRETIKFALELNPDALSFGLMVPNPGSPIRKMAEDENSGMRILHNKWDEYNQFNYSCYELTNIPLAELRRWQSRAYFSFYMRHPVKALNMVFDRSSYNYKFKALIKIPLMLLRNKRMEI
ncbi:MAG: cobalamin-dependent protein [Sedimentisphaerales bacterium]|nr:cobalamin-dependent protein [Sedimentisphaerales bacterium]